MAIRIACRMLRFEFSYPQTVPSKSRGRIPFDPVHDATHRALLDRQIEAWKKTTPRARAAVFDYIDEARHVAVLVDRDTTSVDSSTDGVKRIQLSAAQQKPSKGEEVRQRYESDYPGYTLTVFHPYTGEALLERIPDEWRRVRGQVAAALKLHDWDVRVTPNDDGGWHIVLDEGVVYQPAVMDARMQEACETVGRIGWWFQADAEHGCIDIHPGEPPTFPKLVDFPFDRLGDSATRDRMPFGVQPARPGETARPAVVDWTQSPGLLVAGLSGGGKAQPLDARLPVPVSDRFPDGWATMGSLRVGDPVFTPNGSTTPIASFSDVVEREVFEVHLSDGQVVRCAPDHLWRVVDAMMREQVVTASWLRDHADAGWMIHCTKPIQGVDAGSVEDDGGRIPVRVLRGSHTARLRFLLRLLDRPVMPSACSLTVSDAGRARDLVELIRSLGFQTSCTDTGTGYRLMLSSSPYLTVVSVTATGVTVPMRCIRLDTPDHLYLTEGFVPTHNSVTINDVIAMSVAAGAELYVVDHSTKATDFYWCRPWVADRGWGADSLLQTCGLLKRLLDDIEDGGERATAWKTHGWQNWYDDLTDEDKRDWPWRLIVVDELSQLTVGGKDASSLPKNPLPPVMERMFEQQVKSLILSTLIRLLQIGRAYGYRVVVATQIASSTTGMPPALRGNLGNKMIMGAKVNDNQKNLVFNIPRAVPDVPANVIMEGVSKGAGMAEFEGQEPFTFKSAFPMAGSHAGVDALGRALMDRVGLPHGLDENAYLASLDKSTPSDPVFERMVMDRIRFPEAEAYARFPFLQAMKDKWDEALAAYGGTSTETSEEKTAPASPAPQVKPVDGGAVMDAAALARLMRAG